MYITPEMIREVELKYGSPDILAFVYEMKPNEFEMVRRTQKNGRAHDVTLFIFVGNKVAVIRKHMYPPGAYRPPSGGISPGEGFEEGAIREAFEETGLRVTLDRYLLRVRVRFTCGPRAIAWTTHVLTAKPIPDETEQSADDPLEPRDTHEIAEGKFVTLDELNGEIRTALIRARSTGLRYRAELTDEVVSRLIRAQTG